MTQDTDTARARFLAAVDDGAIRWPRSADEPSRVTREELLGHLPEDYQVVEVAADGEPPHTTGDILDLLPPGMVVLGTLPGFEIVVLAREDGQRLLLRVVARVIGRVSWLALPQVAVDRHGWLDQAMAEMPRYSIDPEGLPLTEEHTQAALGMLRMGLLVFEEAASLLADRHCP